MNEVLFNYNYFENHQGENKNIAKYYISIVF